MFSPNNDDNNANEKFLVYGNGIESITFKVFNRWGDLVYESADLTEIQTSGWDGTFSGVEQPAGIYVWTLEGLDINEIPLLFNGKNTGTVLLKR